MAVRAHFALALWSAAVFRRFSWPLFDVTCDIAMKCVEEDLPLTKAMRGLIALPKHFVQNQLRRLFSFARALGVRMRPRVALRSDASHLAAEFLL